jgi:hypothetical protein
MRLGVLAIVSLAATACSSRAATHAAPRSDCGYPQSRTTPCTVILSGALHETMTCSVEPVYDAFRRQSLVQIGVDSSDSSRLGGRLTVAVRFPGEPRVGTYRNTDPGASSAIYAYSSSYLEEWSENAGPRDAPQGSHTLTITKVGTPYCDSGGKAYPGLRGSLAATLPASSTSTASGTVSLRATF